jgi:uncharacterized protein (TIGR03663 family)
MTRALAGALIGLALAAGLSLRLARLDTRPMHHDEANQAVKFGALLERGEYRYDANDHHGPTLYYFTLPAAWIRGQHTLAELDEDTLRGVTVAAGVATILLLPLLSAAVGRTAVVASAWLMAMSPVMVFYSRMYIQESLFAAFTLAFAIALGRAIRSDGLRWPVVAGVAGGLAVATKETSVLVLPAAVVACAVASYVGPGFSRADRPPPSRRRRALLAGFAAAAAVVLLFYSSFFTAPASLLEPFRGAGTYVNRGLEPSAHAHPWHYYLGLLAWSRSGGVTWSEGAVLVLALAGSWSAWRDVEPSGGRGFWTRYLVTYAILTTAIFSALPYKTPWNILPFYSAVLVVAGLGFAWLTERLPSATGRAILTALVAIAAMHLGWQAWRASVTYAADPRNPYVYAQTVPDAVRMATRIRDLAALDTHGAAMQVSVIASPYEQWPLPWYLRAMPNVGYWTAPGDPVALQAPVIVSSMEHSGALDAALGDRYVSEFYGLRPNVLLSLYIERDLWNRFLGRAVTP